MSDFENPGARVTRLIIIAYRPERFDHEERSSLVMWLLIRYAYIEKVVYVESVWLLLLLLFRITIRAHVDEPKSKCAY